jgi:ribosomal protein L7Ae-like RNA K-turn-binding protein
MFPIFLAPRMYDKDLEVLISEFLQELVMFQKRAYKKNPKKQKRRVVFGFKECKKAIQIENRAKMIIVARDVSIQTLVENDFNQIRKDQAPLIVGLTKWEMGSIIGGRGESSIATIINADGSYEKFHQIRERSQELIDKFVANELRPEYFWYICAFGHIKVLDEFKKTRQEIKTEFVNEGMTSLFACIKGLGELEMIKILIEYFNCDYSLVDFSLNTILHLAVHRNLEIVKYLVGLLSRSLFWRKRNMYSRNILLEAITTKNHEIVGVFSDNQFWNIEEQKEAMIASSKLPVNGPLGKLIDSQFIIPNECLVEAAKHSSHNNVQLLSTQHIDKEQVKEAYNWAKRIECEPMAIFLSKHLC